MERKHNIELLRVLSMFLVVVGHFCYNCVKLNPILGSFPIDGVSGFVSWSIIEIIWLIACVAVDCFVMISGYFLVDRVSFRWTGTLVVWFETFFYSLVLFGIYCISNHSFSLRDFVSAATPIHSNQYWFIKNYVGLMLVSPFLSLLARQLSKQQYQMLLIIGGVLSFKFLYGECYAGTMSFSWFIYLFFAAGYIRLHGLPDVVVENSGKIWWGMLAMFFISVLLYNTYSNIKQGESFHLKSSAYDGVMFFFAVATFIFFLKIDISKSKVLIKISKLAPYTLGVYLIHENLNVKQLGLWKFVARLSEGHPLFLCCILSAIIIFGSCCVIDFFRKKCFDTLKIPQICKKITRKLPEML